MADQPDSELDAIAAQLNAAITATLTSFFLQPEAVETNHIEERLARIEAQLERLIEERTTHRRR